MRGSPGTSTLCSKGASGACSVTAERTRREIEKARDLSADSVDAIAALGYVHGLSGGEDEARAILRELQRRVERGYVSPIRLAQLYLALGELDQAVEWVERAVEARAVGLIWLDVQPIFRRLREDSRFQPIRGKVFA